MNNPFRPRPPNAHDPRGAPGPQRPETGPGSVIGEENHASTAQPMGRWLHLHAESHHTPAANPFVGDITDGHEGRRHKDKDAI